MLPWIGRRKYFLHRDLKLSARKRSVISVVVVKVTARRYENLLDDERAEVEIHQLVGREEAAGVEWLPCFTEVVFTLLPAAAAAATTVSPAAVVVVVVGVHFERRRSCVQKMHVKIKQPVVSQSGGGGGGCGGSGGGDLWCCLSTHLLLTFNYKTFNLQVSAPTYESMYSDGPSDS